MKKKARLVIALSIILFNLQNIYAQPKTNPNYFHLGVFADVSAEFIYLHYVRIGTQKYLSKNISIQGSLMVGSGSKMNWYIPSNHDGVPINWINWHVENPNGNPFVFALDISDPKKLGITSYPIDDQSLFYTNLVFSAGFDIPIIFKLRLQVMAGLGLRYTDEHYIGESGDATFENNGILYQLYYLIPVYQRGIDGHLNLETSLVYPLSENLNLRGGLLSDFTIGSTTVGVGNYYHAGLSILVKL